MMNLSVDLMVTVLERFSNVTSDMTALTNQMSHLVVGEFLTPACFRYETTVHMICPSSVSTTPSPDIPILSSEKYLGMDRYSRLELVNSLIFFPKQMHTKMNNNVGNLLIVPKQRKIHASIISAFCSLSGSFQNVLGKFILL